MPEAVPLGEEHEHDENCRLVLERIQEFLDHELDDATEDAVREHLAACEPCLDQAEVWTAVRTLVQRACPPTPAPASLVSRITLRIATVRVERQ
ncbi:MAG: mycothiol system anti-sigma-R factor [Actinomycetia bacterium]|nr:mycothiol system anti-sigma-R factor [Actinomycetes bacterium]